MIDPPQQHHLDQHADRGNDQRRRDNTGPEPERAGKAFGQRERDIGAEHVESAMGEIDDPRHAEDDRQARRHQKQRRRAGKTGQELDDVKGHVRSARFEKPLLACGERKNNESPESQIGMLPILRDGHFVASSG